MDYVVAVYEFVAGLPEQEKYNLASQLRRAATSAPLNIAEGCGAAPIQSWPASLASPIVRLKKLLPRLNSVNGSIRHYQGIERTT